MKCKTVSPQEEGFGNWDFEFVSDFVIRISDLPTVLPESSGCRAPRILWP